MHFKLLYTKVFNFNTTKVGGATEQPYWNCTGRDLSPCTGRTTAQLTCMEDGIAINDDEEFAPSLSRPQPHQPPARSPSARRADPARTGCTVPSHASHVRCLSAGTAGHGAGTAVLLCAGHCCHSPRTCSRLWPRAVCRAACDLRKAPSHPTTSQGEGQERARGSECLPSTQGVPALAPRVPGTAVCGGRTRVTFSAPD